MLVACWHPVATARGSVMVPFAGVNPNAVSGSPHAHPVDLYLLRKYSAAAWTADKVAPDGQVEENKELALKLGRAIHSVRDITLEVLDPIDIPFD